MSGKGIVDNSPSIDKALEVGYRASISVGIASRRASEDIRPEILNEVNGARASIEEALFSLEEVNGVEGSIRESVSKCQEFMLEYKKVLESGELDRYAVGTLQCGLDEAECATESLKGIVDGYKSLGEDKM